MGIPGLLIALKSVTYPVHISEYRGLTVGVDAYCWLHRGAFSCGKELCTGVTTDKYVTFCMKRVNLMRQHGVEPIMVFDGASLPLKGGKHLERRRQRGIARSKGEAALAAGEAGAAAQHFSKAVEVTYDMAFALIKELRRSRVELIVAPYEADAQLAYLSRSGLVDAVITEDSDCLPYGCKKVLFKMDNEGHGQEIQLRNLAANTPLTLCSWKNSMFLDLCLLVGCDYMTANIKRLGITTAHGLVQRHRSLDKIIRAVESSKFEVPEGYWEEYKRARLTFRHHIVYDPHTQSTIHLMPLGQNATNMDNLDFLGVHLPLDVVQGLVTGDLLPTTHQPYEADRVEPRPSTYPPSTSTDRPNTTEKGSSHVRAVTNNVSIIDGPTSKHQMGKFGIDDTGKQADGRRHYSDPGRGDESEKPTQTALMGAFIDKPFDTGKRPALAELPFPCKETSQASTGWNAPEQESSFGWGLQSDERDGFTSPYCRNRSDGSGTSPPSNFGEKHLFRGKRLSSSAGVVGTDPIEEIGRMSSASRYFLDNSLRRESWVETPVVGVDSTVGIAEKSNESLSSGHASGLSGRHGSSEVLKGWWGGARPSIGGGNSGRPNWGEDAEAGKMEDAQRVELLPYGRHRSDSSSDRSVYGLRTPEVTSLREGNSVSVDVGGKELNVDGASSVSYGEFDLGQGGASALALVEPPDVDRAKFVPTSAHNFHTTQVSHRLETLHRRKRRLRQISDGAPTSPPLLYGHSHTMHNGIREHGSITYDKDKVMAMMGGSSKRSSEEDSFVEDGDMAWMIQSDVTQTQHRTGGQLSEPGNGGTKVKSRGITSFQMGIQREPASRPSSSHFTRASSLHQEGLASPCPRGGGNEVSSRPWTMPLKMHLQSTSRAVQLPLLRLLDDSSRDHSWHDRIDGQQASNPLTKRTRGTEFWDARLMR